MHFETEVDALARSYGIEPFYWDIVGTQHFASTETKIALLAAMGVEISDEASVEKAKTDLELKHWEEVLPPVVIFRPAEKRLSLDIRLPEDRWSVRLDWKVDKSAFGGSVELESLPVHEERKGLNGKNYQRRNFQLELLLPSGYHILRLGIAGERYQVLVLATPERCFFPQLQNAVFGISGQLYSLKSNRNSGLGDLGDLFEAKDVVAASGAKFIGLNPLHALFEASADSISPYSPSTRLAWNPLVIAGERIPENSIQAGANKSQNAQTDGLVDYGRAWAERKEIWETCYKNFLSEHSGKNTERELAFRRYLTTVNTGTKEYALYAALREHLLKLDSRNWGWPAWPLEYRDPQSEAVVRFAMENISRVEFHLYLQFLADSQLAELTGELEEAGVSLGLYLDLALGANSGGAETWFRRSLYAFSASMGAPPDELGPLGQVWGLPPLMPQQLRDSQFAVFRQALAHTMSHAKAVRIDHIMSLFRLYWVPEGKTAKDGGYVRYPFEELLAIVCIESERNKCVVIGEDLGTVPDEVREGMQRTGILSYKVLYFMHHDRDFLPSSSYPKESLVVTSTHDLPTMKSFWSGLDIELRWELKLFAEDKLYPFSKELREKDRCGLRERLRQEGLLPKDELQGSDLSAEDIIAFHAFLARTPSMLQAIQLEDLAQLKVQANLPGTVNAHPNWRRSLPLSLSEILQSVFAKKLLASVQAERK